MINVGFIGVGARGYGTHVNLIHNYFSSICNIVCICDKYQEKTDKINTDLNTNFTTYNGEHSYKEMLKNETLDVVIISTPWEWHAKMVIECMNNGIRSGVEVPMATTVEECERIIETYKKTGIDSMILENVCWREDVLAVLNMIRLNIFGEIKYSSGGYMHDIRSSLINQERYQDWWRIEHYKNRIGDNYPTHGLGPVMNWLNINKGNRLLKLTSYSNKATGLKHILKNKKNTINKYYDGIFNTGDIVKTLIQTSSGQIIEITFNTTSARPYSLDFTVQGTNGLWDRRLGISSKSSIYLEEYTANNSTTDKYNFGDNSCQSTHQWEDGDVYVKRYKHPLYIKFHNQFQNGGFHGGMDWYMMNNFLNSIINNKEFSISIYDSVIMSVITDLSRQSILLGNKSIDVPDFTDGFWMDNKKYFENGYYVKDNKIEKYNTNIYYCIVTDYKKYIHDNNFHLYESTHDSTEDPIEFTNENNLVSNKCFSVNSIDTLYTYLSFNHSYKRDSHYIIIKETQNIKVISFYFKKYKQIFDIDTHDYWSYLIDGRPGGINSYIAFRMNTVLIGSNIEKVELNNTIIDTNIGATLHSNIEQNKWYKIKIYFKEKFTDDLSLFSRYNIAEDFDGCIANLIIYDDNNNEINKYNFNKYDINNRFLNLITNEYDLKVNGSFDKNLIHNIENTDTLFNSTKSNTEIYADNNVKDLILFFKREQYENSKRFYSLY